MYRLRRWASACGRQPPASSAMHLVPTPATSTWLWRTPAGAMSSSCRRCTSPANPSPSTVTGVYLPRKCVVFNSHRLGTCVLLHECFVGNPLPFANSDRFVHTILFLTAVLSAQFLDKCTECSCCKLFPSLLLILPGQATSQQSGVLRSPTLSC